jgi:hypothetical protein
MTDIVSSQGESASGAQENAVNFGNEQAAASQDEATLASGAFRPRAVSARSATPQGEPEQENGGEPAQAGKPSRRRRAKRPAGEATPQAGLAREGAEPAPGAQSAGAEPTTAYGLMKDLGAKKASVEQAREALAAAAERGLSLEGKNAKGLGGLHACAQMRRWDLAGVLLEMGANPLAKSKTGLSFFAMASRDAGAPFEELFAARPELLERKRLRDAQRAAGVTQKQPEPQAASGSESQRADAAEPEAADATDNGEKKLSRSAKKRRALKEKKARLAAVERGDSADSNESESSQGALSDEEFEERSLEIADELAWARINGLDAQKAQSQANALRQKASRPTAAPKRKAASAWGEGLAPLSAEENETAAREEVFWPQNGSMSAAEAMEQAVLGAQNGDFSATEIYLALGRPAGLCGEDGRTLLQRLALLPEPAALIAALDQGADANARNLSGETALMSALEAGRSESARALANHGADVDARDGLGRVAMLRLIEAEHAQAEDAVEWLLGFGANAKLRDAQGRAAGEIAESLGLFDIADMIEAHLEAAGAPAPAPAGAPAPFDALLGGKAAKAKKTTNRPERKKTPGAKNAQASKPAAKTAKPAKKRKAKKPGDPVARATRASKTGFVSDSLGRSLRAEKEWWEQSAPKKTDTVVVVKRRRLGPSAI